MQRIYLTSPLKIEIDKQTIMTTHRLKQPRKITVELWNCIRHGLGQ